MPDPNNLTFMEDRITFMAIPKCANTSLKLAVCRAWGLDAHYPGLNHFVAQLVSNHGAIRTNNKQWIARQNNHFVVTIIRHPQARIASFIRDKVKSNHVSASRININRDTPLDEVVHRICETQDDTCDQHIRSLSHELIWDEFVIADFIARVETLNADWVELCQAVKRWCGRDLGRLPKCNGTNGPSLSFTDDQVAMLSDRYGDDFEYFGYKPRLGSF